MRTTTTQGNSNMKKGMNKTIVKTNSKAKTPLKTKAPALDYAVCKEAMNNPKVFVVAICASL